MSEKEKTSKAYYAILRYDIREELDVNSNEYCILYTIWMFTSKPGGKCDKSKEGFAKDLGVTKRAIFKMLRRLESRNYIIVNGRLLTITDTVKAVLDKMKLLVFGDEKSSPDKVNKVHHKEEQSSKSSGNKVHSVSEESSSKSIGERKGLKKKEKKLSKEAQEREILILLSKEIQDQFEGATNENDIMLFLNAKYDDETLPDFMLAIKFNTDRKREGKKAINYWGYFKTEWEQYSYDNINQLKKRDYENMNEGDRAYWQYVDNSIKDAAENKLKATLRDYLLYLKRKHES